MNDPLVTGPTPHESVLTLAAVSNRIDELDDRHGVTVRQLNAAKKDITSLSAITMIAAVVFIIVAIVISYFVHHNNSLVKQLNDQQTASDVNHAQVEQTQRAAQCKVIDALRGDFLGNTPAYSDLNNRLMQARNTLRCTP